MLKTEKVAKFILRVISHFHPVRPKYCICCKSSVPYFLPFLIDSNTSVDLAKELDIVGSDLQNAHCPYCGCNDRDRHLQIFFESTFFPQIIKGSRILHFAPEAHLGQYIKSLGPNIYRKADLHPCTNEIEQLDIQRMTVEDSEFNLVIANHVLEHVLDYALALNEISRVLKPDGYALLQTPFSRVLGGLFEHPELESASQRTYFYGQSDHLRVFGRDFIELVCSFGFEYVGGMHGELARSFDAYRYGVNYLEPFLFFKKVQTPKNRR